PLAEVALPGLGLATTCQPEPPYDIVSVCREKFVLSRYQPTAQGRPDALPATASSALSSCALGLGTTRQAEPARTIVSVFNEPWLDSLYSPTAHTCRPATATPVRIASKPGLGVGTADQRRPSKCSAAGWSLPSFEMWY